MLHGFLNRRHLNEILSPHVEEVFYEMKLPVSEMGLYTLSHFFSTLKETFSRRWRQ